MSNSGDRKAPDEVYYPTNPQTTKIPIHKKAPVEVYYPTNWQPKTTKRPIHKQQKDQEKTAVRGADESLDQPEDTPALQSPEAWKIWKKQLLTNQPKMQEFGSQLAVYMHCMLQ